MTTTQKFILIPVLALTVLGGGALMGYAGLSYAERGSGSHGDMMRGMFGGEMHDREDRIFGTITQIDGTTITVRNGAGKEYIVDGSAASVRLYAAPDGEDTIRLSDLRVGDVVRVRGDIDGTTVRAERISKGDGMYGHGKRHGHHGGGGLHGEVTAKNGDTLTVKTRDGRTVTVEGKDAVVSRIVDASLSDVSVGDSIGVRGSWNGDTVTAKRIMDDVADFEDRDGDDE